jgi:hypothetical protein
MFGGNEMRKLAVLLALCGALVVVPAASGQPITGICSFPISIETAAAHGDMVHFLPTDQAPFVVAVTGQSFQTLTNLDNGNSITVNASGPLLQQPDGSLLFLGQTLFGFNRVIGDIPQGLYLTSGPALVTFNQAGMVADVDLLSGVISANLCDAIA